MNYKQIHDNIINKAKSDNRIKSKELYYERHHIIPKCLNGDNNKSNLVLLLPKEHYVIHKLLVELYPNNKSLWYAVHRMTFSKNFKNKRSYRISSREYERLRIKNSKLTSEARLGKPLTKEHKEKVSIAGMGRKAWNKGVKNCHSEETLQKIKKVHIGSHRSQQTKDKISKANSGENSCWYGKKWIKEEHPMFGKYGILNPNFGSKRTEEQKRNISKSLIGRKLSEEHKQKLRRKGKDHPMYGRNHSEESKLKMKLNHKDYSGENHPKFGLKLNEITKNKISEAHLKLSILKCPWCGLESRSRANMTRYHFDNCKFKSNNLL